MAHIFICGDTGLEHLLGEAADTLVGLGHEVVRGPRNEIGSVREYSAAEGRALLAPADVAVFTARHRCSRALLMQAERLRGVCYAVIGIETLDVAAADELGIIVGHGAVHANIVGMAEATIMLMLMASYRVQPNIALLAAGEWRRPVTAARQLHGKTIGLVGFGRIAREVAARLQPFGARIVTSSPRTRPEDLPAGVEKRELAELLRESDVVGILTGLTPETRHLIGAAELALMKPGALLVNTGRGEVIDEAALYAHLRDRRIDGAALDTFTVEPLPAQSPLRTLDNVILTPHCVGHSVEGTAALGPALVENIVRIAAGELPLHCANPGAEPAWRRRIKALDAAGVD